MNRKNILVLMGLLIGLASCKNEMDNENDSSLIGKWQEVKSRTYDKSYSGIISDDTTYLSAAFDTTDYALFNSNSTCVLSNHYIYYGLNGSTNPDGLVNKQNYTYTPVGSKYVLAVQTALISPSGFTTTDTASRSGNTLLIHSIFDNHQYYIITDAYYSK